MTESKTYNIGNIENATFLNRSVDYQDLVERIAEKREFLSYVPQEKVEKRLTLSEELAALEQQLEQFKEDVCRFVDMSR